jgi:hypothetical protein
MLWGVLIDEIRESSFTSGVFEAYLVSDRTQRIVCERPKYIAGLGTTREGLLVTEFESDLFGRSTIAEKRSETGGVYEAAENRIRIITNSDIDDATVPAFLSFNTTSAPVKTRAVIELDVRTLKDLPDVRALISTERYLLKNSVVSNPLQRGVTLPVSCSNGQSSYFAALTLQEEAGKERVSSVMYHEAGVLPCVGDVLERSLTIPDRAGKEGPIRFHARIGEIHMIE